MRSILAKRTGWPVKLIVPVSVLLAAWVGRAIALGGQFRMMALGITALALLPAVVPALRLRERFGHSYMAVEIPLLFLLVSTLVFRQRDAEDLASNPLDPAGLFRVAFVFAGLFLGLIALTSTAEADSSAIRSRPFRLYAVYVIVVFIGAPLSVEPLQTAYRGLELAAGWIVIAGARHVLGAEGVPRLERTLYWYLVGIAATVWGGVILVPGLAVTGTDFALGASPIPWQINGVFPSVSSNGVGDLGSTLLLWSLAYRLTPNRSYGPRPGLATALTALGFLTLIGAQYRTGYLAAAAGLAVILAVRKRAMLAALAVVAVLLAGIWGSVLVTRAEPYVLRGQTTEAATELSGRLYWWENALPVWRESPIFGKGLLTATRFEVLEELGAGETSTIHGTWIEALVGTGIVGAGVLLITVLILWKRSIAAALRRPGALVPIVLLTQMSVRSFTGPTFETFGRGALIILVLALVLPDRAWGGRHSPAGEHIPLAHRAG